MLPPNSAELAVTAPTVIVMALCETERLVLHPDQTYRFRVMPGCARCAELARNADGETPHAR